MDAGAYKVMEINYRYYGCCKQMKEQLINVIAISNYVITNGVVLMQIIPVRTVM